MRLLWLPAELRAAGLSVREYPGWQTRGLSTFGPIRGVVCHGTAGNIAIETDLRIIAITGSGTAAAPIANLVLARDGVVWVVASGTCTGVKTGIAGPLQGYSDDAVVQIEAAHAASEPWSAVQYRAYVRLCAVLVAHREPGYNVPVAHVIGHSEHQPGQKTDPWLDMAAFRRDVAATVSNAFGRGQSMYLLTKPGDGTVYLVDGFQYRGAPDGPTAAQWRAMGLPERAAENEAQFRVLAGDPWMSREDFLAAVRAAAEEGARAGAGNGGGGFTLPLQLTFEGTGELTKRTT